MNMKIGTRNIYVHEDENKKLIYVCRIKIKNNPSGDGFDEAG